MVTDNTNETPALDKLFNNQGPEKVKNFMSEVYKSKDKVKMYKKLFEEKQIIFEMIEKPEMLQAILDSEVPDSDMADFVNIKDSSENTALHVAVDRNRHASSALLLKAGNFQLIANRDAHPPTLENLFQQDRASEITDSLVRGLLQKSKMKHLEPEETLMHLKILRDDGTSILSLVDSSHWDDLAATHGFGVKIAKLAPIMPAEFANWLVLKTEKESGWFREDVYQGLTEVTEDGKTAFALLADCSLWGKVAAWKRVGVKIADLAPSMPTEFAEWLLAKAAEVEQAWDKKELHACLKEKNQDGKTCYDRLNLVDTNRWDKVATAVGVHVAELAPTMDKKFAEWLLLEAQKKGWSKAVVHQWLMKENKEGQTSYDRLSLLDADSRNLVADGIGDHICEIGPELGHAIGGNFAEWLVMKTEQEDWNRKMVFYSLKEQNKDGKTMSTLLTDCNMWNKIAAWEGVGCKIADIAPFMEGEFTKWLLGKTEKEDWNKKQVFESLQRKNEKGIKALDLLVDCDVWNRIAAWEGIGVSISELAPTLGRQFAEWLVMKTAEEGWSTDRVYKALTEKNNEGKNALSLVASHSILDQVASWEGVREAIARVSAATGETFIGWLVLKTETECWDRGRVYSCLTKQNEKGKIPLAFLTDCNIFNKIAVWEEKKTALIAAHMGVEFVKWLVRKSTEEGWDTKYVYKGLTMRNKEGRTALSRLGIQMWQEVSMWTPKKGIHFTVDNTQLKEAVQVWSRTFLSTGEAQEEEGARVRHCIQEKGAVVKLNSSVDLRAAVLLWNENNTDLCEY